MLASIIINNYNYGRYLKDAIESALNQTYPDVEVIVVDDGSEDNSRDIIQNYGDRIVPILKANGGQASAFNAGLTASRGEVVIFLDSDDALLPAIVERVVQAFRENSDAARVQYRMEVVDASGMPTGAVKPSPHLPVRSGDILPYVLAFPFDLTWMATSGNAFAACVLKRIFPVPEQDFRILADFYLAHLTPLFGPVIALDDIGAQYRVHGENHHEAPSLDLKQIRQVITYSCKTLAYQQRYVQELHLMKSNGRRNDWGSVSLVAERLISLKLDPQHHPLPYDTVGDLFRLGTRSALARFDVSMPFKLLLFGWFGAMAIAPRPLAFWLAEKFQVPETRGSFNTLLERFNRVR